jgi:hypothetical protein
MTTVEFPAQISRLIERFVDTMEKIAIEMKRMNDLKKIEQARSKKHYV